jgi:hypothetical protein
MRTIVNRANGTKGIGQQNQRSEAQNKEKGTSTWNTPNQTAKSNGINNRFSSESRFGQQ